MSKNQLVTLEVSGTQFNFSISRTAYNKFVDGSNSGNITQSAWNFCTSAVKDDQKTTLVELLDSTPSLEIVLANSLAEEYTPEDLRSLVKPVSKSQKKA